jgi:GT2 family glycosyltransferase
MQSALAESDVVEGRTICPSENDDPFEERVENPSGGLFWSCNLGFRRTVFQRLGGFDEDFPDAAGEDMELAYRIQALPGLRIRFAPRAEVTHPVRRMDGNRLIWRTKLQRWMVLYHLKTGDSPSKDAPFLRVAAWRIWTEFATAVRLSWRCISRFPHRFPRRECFQVIWRWVTLPFMLPYLLFWEYRIRQWPLTRRTQLP